MTVPRLGSSSSVTLLQIRWDVHLCVCVCKKKILFLSFNYKEFVCPLVIHPAKAWVVEMWGLRIAFFANYQYIINFLETGFIYEVWHPSHITRGSDSGRCCLLQLPGISWWTGRANSASESSWTQLQGIQPHSRSS